MKSLNLPTPEGMSHPGVNLKKFFPHIHTRCNTSFLRIYKNIVIPTQHPLRVRLMTDNKIPVKFISTHTPTQGATPPNKISTSCIAISTRAPSIGAISFRLSSFANASCFNPQTYQRSDSWDLSSTTYVWITQHPHGEQRSRSSGRQPRTDFNPRTLARCDAHFKRDVFRFWHFNLRTLTRCVRSIDWQPFSLDISTQHPRKVRLFTLPILPKSTIFQPAHPQGVRISSIWC